MINNTNLPLVASVRSRFVLNQTKKISFNGIPFSLPDLPMDDAKDAILIFDYLKLGNYLDSSDDDICPNNKKIREKNLLFLDKLYSTRDKQLFIDYYKRLTGFPDLSKVSTNIENEFVSVIRNASSTDKYDDFYCLAAGYDESCSVGKRKAFPGSDLDKAFVVIAGSNNNDENVDVVNEFKKRIWEKTDQRILSYNHDTSFPNVYTIKQIKDLLKKIDIATSGMSLDKNRLTKNVEEECFNLEKAGEYNIAISKYFPINIDSKNPSDLNKENVKNFAFFIEALKEGKIVIDTPEFQQLKEEIKNYDFYKYSNVAHIKGMKNLNKTQKNEKKKIQLRREIQDNFNNWNIEKQFAFIKTLIKASCEDNKDESYYFTNEIDMKKRYKDFLAILTKGTTNLLFQPEFEEIGDAIVMKYGKNKKVHLYQGHSDKILWVDALGDDEAVVETLRQIDKLRLNNKFKNVIAIQYPAYYSNVKGFEKTPFNTASGVPIYGKRI